MKLGIAPAVEVKEEILEIPIRNWNKIYVLLERITEENIRDTYKELKLKKFLS